MEVGLVMEGSCGDQHDVGVLGFAYGAIVLGPQMRRRGWPRSSEARE